MLLDIEKMLQLLIAAMLATFVLGGNDITSSDIARINQRLQNIMGGSIPDKVQKLIAVLEKNLHILNCLPINRVGNCYRSNKCVLPELNFKGLQLSTVLSICKDPWKIVVDFELPKLPWYVDVKFDSLVIPVDHNSGDGVTKINSVTRGKVKLLKFYNIFKAELRIDALIRWDCTKPRHDLLTRGKYNSQAPDRKYNSMFYKFKVRVELKKKSWFRYKCKRCEDLVDKEGSFGSGPQSCVSDMGKYFREVEKRRMERQRNCGAAVARRGGMRCHLP